MDQYAVLDGRRGHPDGPVGGYHIANISGSRSRGMNKIEQMLIWRHIEECMQARITQAREVAAKQMLAPLRDLLKPFNLRNHIVFIEASMGTCGLRVIKRRPAADIQWVCDMRGTHQVLLRLQSIDQMIEGNYDVIQHLDGMHLT